MYVRDDDSYKQQKQRHKDRLLEEELLQFFVFLSTDFVFPSDFVYMFFTSMYLERRV